MRRSISIWGSVRPSVGPFVRLERILYSAKTRDSSSSYKVQLTIKMFHDSHYPAYHLRLCMCDCLYIVRWKHDIGILVKTIWLSFQPNYKMFLRTITTAMTTTLTSAKIKQQRKGDASLFARTYQSFSTSLTQLIESDSLVIGQWLSFS